MSECAYKMGTVCSLGQYAGKPTDEDCGACSMYSGPTRGLGDVVHRVAATIGGDKIADFRERGKTIVCVVGQELKGTAGVLGKIFGAISTRGIKAKMVSQSASELNVAFLVDNDEITPAVRALHELLLEDA